MTRTYAPHFSFKSIIGAHEFTRHPMEPNAQSTADSASLYITIYHSRQFNSIDEDFRQIKSALIQLALFLSLFVITEHGHTPNYHRFPLVR